MKDYLVKLIAAGATYLFTYFTPTFPLLLAIGFFVVSDLITGILAAKKRGEPVTSKKARPSVMKGVGYMVAILVAHVFQTHFVPALECMKIVAGLISLIELKSIDENIRVITGKSLFKQFMNK